MRTHLVTLGHTWSHLVTLTTWSLRLQQLIHHMMSKYLKNCEVVYFKDIDKLYESLEQLRGKVVISDFPEVESLCIGRGITHVHNVNDSFIPSEKLDCIVIGQRNQELENKIINNSLGVPIVFEAMKWCGKCGSVSSLRGPVSKYCSEKCMKRDSGLSHDLTSGEAMKSLNRTESNTSDGPKATAKSLEKFQTSMVKDAIRLEYAFKRELYKKEMRQPSLRKAMVSDKKSHVETSVRTCKCVTKKGSRCTNRTVGNSDYCGIISHMAIASGAASAIGVATSASAAATGAASGADTFD
jgi:hypothetical protein